MTPPRQTNTGDEDGKIPSTSSSSSDKEYISTAVVEVYSSDEEVLPNSDEVDEHDLSFPGTLAMNEIPNDSNELEQLLAPLQYDDLLMEETLPGTHPPTTSRRANRDEEASTSSSLHEVDNVASEDFSVVEGSSRDEQGDSISEVDEEASTSSSSDEKDNPPGTRRPWRYTGQQRRYEY